MFNKTYWFSSQKGYFRIIVSEDGDYVQAEASPNKFVCLKDLWPTRCTKTRKREEIEKIKLQHLFEYELMLKKLRELQTLEEQNVYIKSEMKSQGYTFVK